MDLESRLRAGEAHDPEQTKKPGSLAIQCITCPRPTFNLPDTWKNEPKQYAII